LRDLAACRDRFPAQDFDRHVVDRRTLANVADAILAREWHGERAAQALSAAPERERKLLPSGAPAMDTKPDQVAVGKDPDHVVAGAQLTRLADGMGACARRSRARSAFRGEGVLYRRCQGVFGADRHLPLCANLSRALLAVSDEVLAMCRAERD